MTSAQNRVVAEADASMGIEPILRAPRTSKRSEVSPVRRDGLKPGGHVEGEMSGKSRFKVLEKISLPRTLPRLNYCGVATSRAATELLSSSPQGRLGPLEDPLSLRHDIPSNLHFTAAMSGSIQNKTRRQFADLNQPVGGKIVCHMGNLGDGSRLRDP